MSFLTPFALTPDGIRDRNFHRFEPRARLLRLPASAAEAAALPERYAREGFNWLQIELAMEQLADPEGMAAWEAFLAETRRAGLYFGLTPLFPDRDPAKAAELLNTLFYHRCPVSGDCGFESENWAAIEPVPDPALFGEYELHGYLHRLRPFINHVFGNRLIVCYLLERGPVPAELEYALRKFGFLTPLVLTEAPERLRFLRAESGPARLREIGTGLPHPIAPLTGDPTVYTWACARPAEFRIELPFTPIRAEFRPSLRQDHPVRIEGRILAVTLPPDTRGVLEAAGEQQTFRVHLFAEGLAESSAGIRLGCDTVLSDVNDTEISGSVAIGELRLEGCCNIVLEDLVVRRLELKNCSGVTLRRVKVTGSFLPDGCRDLLAESCFFRVSESAEVRPSAGRLEFRDLVLFGASPDRLLPGNIDRPEAAAEIRFEGLDWVCDPALCHRILSLPGAVYRDLRAESPAELKFEVCALTGAGQRSGVRLDGVRLAGEIGGVRLHGFEFAAGAGFGDLEIRNCYLHLPGGRRRKLRDLLREEVRFDEDYFEFRHFFEDIYEL